MADNRPLFPEAMGFGNCCFGTASDALHTTLFLAESFSMRRMSNSPTLIPERIVESLRMLSDRVHSRFPDRGLARHVEWFVDYAGRVLPAGESNLKAPKVVRAASWIGGVAVTAALFSPIYFVRRIDGMDQLPVFLGSLDALVTVLAATVGGFYTMRSIEHEFVRRQALAGLHTLRSFAHVTDMLQVTKSPTQILFPGSEPADGVVIQSGLRDDAASLSHYLTYCSELYALTAKVAALYGEWTSDTVVLSAVDDIEDLCANLESKTTQKILLLEQLNQRVRFPSGR